MNNPKTETSVEIDLEDSFDFSADIDDAIDISLEDDVLEVNKIDNDEIKSSDPDDLEIEDEGFEVDLDDFILPIVDKPLDKNIVNDITDETFKNIKVNEENVDEEVIQETIEIKTIEIEKGIEIETDDSCIKNTEIDKKPTVNTVVNEELIQKILQKSTEPSTQASVQQPFENVTQAVSVISEMEQDKQQKPTEQSENTQEAIQSPVQETAKETVEAVSQQKQQTEDSPQTVEQTSADKSPADQLAVNKPKETTKEENKASTKKESTKEEKGGWFSRMKTGLSKSRKNLADGMMNILVGGKEIDDELLEEVEDQLLVADIGVDATNRIITNLTEQTARGDLIYSHSLYKALQKELVDILTPKVEDLEITPQTNEAGEKVPFVLLMVGVNGVGKTTTIGKLAKRLQAEGKSVMLAAGDTFRAAATEQLQVWGERNDIPVVAQGHGSDSASVIFDAMQSAKAKGIDVLIADTAGRLQNKSNLMIELEKVVRVMKKSDVNAPHECMIVLDAGTGQNAINQVNIFNQAVNVTGITVTKLDGTAKGGVVFNIANTTDIPIRYIGVGESIDDLRAFEPKDFVEALFDNDD